MRSRILLSWILAWVQLRDATSFSIEVWCDAHDSRTTTRVVTMKPRVSANITVDQFFDDHKQKIQDYCLKHCCNLGTCNVGTVNESGNTTACLAYGSYHKGMCAFKKADNDTICHINATAMPLAATLLSSSSLHEDTSTTASAFTGRANTTSKPEITHYSTTTKHNAPTTTESTTTSEYTTVRTDLRHDTSWHQLFKLLQSSVKPRKGVRFNVNSITGSTSTVSKDATYKRTNLTEPKSLTHEHPPSVATSTSAAAEVTAYTKEHLPTAASSNPTVSSSATTSSITSVLNLTTTTSPTTTSRPTATTTPMTTTSPATTESPTTTTHPTTSVRQMTTTNSPTTSPTTTSSATVTLATSTTTSAPPLWETMFTQSNHSSSTEETPAASTASESPHIHIQESSTTSAAKDVAPVRVPDQTTFVVEVGPNEESAPMGLIVGLSLGLVFIFIVLGVVGRQILDLWQRRHYSRMDFLVDGMYH